MENTSVVQRFFQKVIKFTKRLLLIIVILAAIVFAISYWGTFEKGVMAGKVLRLSQKGWVFKTYEGKLNLDTFGALKGVSPIAESFDFSVESDKVEVIKALEEVALSGERVNLQFEKRFLAFPWRGDTRYFIIKVERSENLKQ